MQTEPVMQALQQQTCACLQFAHDGVRQYLPMFASPGVLLDEVYLTQRSV